MTILDVRLTFLLLRCVVKGWILPCHLPPTSGFQGAEIPMAPQQITGTVVRDHDGAMLVRRSDNGKIMYVSGAARAAAEQTGSRRPGSHVTVSLSETLGSS